MDFLEAVKAMKEGKKVRREDWAKSDYCVYVSDGWINHKPLSDKCGSAFPVQTKDIEATDWEIVEEKGEITLADLRKAAKLIKENTPCTCKLTGSMYCPKHNLLKISKEQQREVNKFFGLKEKKTLSDKKFTTYSSANSAYYEEDVKEKLKEYFDRVEPDGSSIPDNYKLAKEIFGERLV